MCGRYTQHHALGEVNTRFNAQQAPLFEPEGPRYNIAPRQEVAVVVSSVTAGRDAGEPEKARWVDSFEWGLVPFWAKDAAIGAKMINARSETVAEKPAFRAAFVKRRCIIPADGFYEWDKIGGARQPIHFRLRSGDMFGFAGLWEEWRDPNSGPETPPLRTCTILTTTANETVGRVHDRMPVILRGAGAESLWLDPDVRKADALLPLLVPYPDAEMEAFAVSRRVNTPATDDASLIIAEGPNSA